MVKDGINICHYCCEPIPMGWYACSRCFKEEEIGGGDDEEENEDPD